MKVKISTSLMCMDMMNVAKEISFLDTKSDYYHIDILDWHYVKNLCLAPCFMEQLSKISSIPQDAHLMVDNIDEDLIKLCLDSGAACITLPPEIVQNKVFRLIRMIHEAGQMVGFYINPAAPLDLLLPYIHLADKLTFMTVDPGYPGQKFIEESLTKVSAARKLREENGYHYLIEVDGSCNKSTYRRLYDAGAECFVVGSTGLFGMDSDISKAWSIMESDINNALR